MKKMKIVIAEINPTEQVDEKCCFNCVGCEYLKDISIDEDNDVCVTCQLLEEK